MMPCFTVLALKTVHEYKAIQSDNGRRRYIEAAKGESFAVRFKNTEMYTKTYEEVKRQVDEMLDSENINVEKVEEDLTYPTSIFTQVYHLVFSFFDHGI